MSNAKKKLCPAHGNSLRRTETRWGALWKCRVEGCTVRCWDGSTSSPCDAETAKARQATHAMFDPLWREEDGPFGAGHDRNTRNARRGRAYKWLASVMGLDQKDTHIGYFSLDQCQAARRAIAARFHSPRKEPTDARG